MKRGGPTWEEPLSQRLFRWSLLAYPRSCRQRDTSGMQHVFARQLREAAEKETDPELKEKLWQEYEEYKKNTGN